jgi:hypothetical protein
MKVAWSIALAVVAVSLATSRAARADPPPDRVSYLDNGTIRLGVDLDLGGSITYLARSNGGENIVNSFDRGREIQLSFYSGPTPFVVGDKRPKPEWAGLGWNPIQSGDCFGNRSKVVDFRNDRTTIYVKCIPMQWPLRDVPGECTFESWVTLEGPTVQVRSRINNARADHTQFEARDQELPAIYTNGPLYRAMAYVGDQPFTRAPLSRLQRTADEVRRAPSFPWTRRSDVTESWAALVDDKDWGLGVWQPGTCSFLAGFAGRPGAGGPHDAPTGYIAPARREVLDWNAAYAFRYVLIVGSLTEIRDYVYAHAARPAVPAYRFEHDRQHWYYHDAGDTGWPIAGELNVVARDAHAQLVGPDDFWLAGDAGRLTMDAAFTGRGRAARVRWKRRDDDRYSDANSVPLDVTADGVYRPYAVALGAQPGYRGTITGLRVDFAATAGDGMRVRSIVLTR